MDIESMIGIGAAVAAVPVLTEHIKQAARAIEGALRGWTVGSGGPSAWPLVCDLVAVGWALALYAGGMLPLPNPVLAVLAGLATGVAASGAYDAVRR